MKRQNRAIVMKVDTYTRVCLTAIAVLMAVLIVGLWADGANVAGRSVAGELPFNSASERKDILAAMQATNDKLDELMKLLRSGEVKVQVVGEGKEKVAGGGGEGATSQSK